MICWKLKMGNPGLGGIYRIFFGGFPEANPSSKPHNYPMKWSFQAQVGARKYRKRYSLKDKSATGADLHINHGYQRKDVKCVTCLWLVDRLFPRRKHYQSMCCLQKEAMMSSKQQINSSSFAGSTPNFVDHSSQVHCQDTQWTVHGSSCETPHPPGSKRENHQQWHMSVLDMMWMFQSGWWFGTWFCPIYWE